MLGPSFRGNVSANYETGQGPRRSHPNHECFSDRRDGLIHSRRLSSGGALSRREHNEGHNQSRYDPPNDTHVTTTSWTEFITGQRANVVTPDSFVPVLPRSMPPHLGSEMRAFTLGAILLLGSTPKRGMCQPPRPPGPHPPRPPPPPVDCTGLTAATTPTLGESYLAHRGLSTMQALCYLPCGGSASFSLSCSGTTAVNLSYNAITRLHPTMFSNLTRLVTLDLAGNGLTSVEQNAFANLSALTTVNLAFNSISNFQFLQTYDRTLSLSLDATVIIAPQSTPARCAYRFSTTADGAFDRRSSDCNQLLEIPHGAHGGVCANASFCRAVFGATSSCCARGFGDCLMCTGGGTQGLTSSACVFCPEDPCYTNTGYSGSFPWVGNATSGYAVSSAGSFRSPDTCPLPHCNRIGGSIPFRFFDVDGEADRATLTRLDDFQHLTVNKTYRFQIVPDIRWERYLNHYCDTRRLSFMSNVTSPPENPTEFFYPQNEVLLNGHSAFFSVTPTREYSGVVAIHVQSGLEEVTLIQWNFTAHDPDVHETSVSAAAAIHPEYGPSGVDCVHGSRVDGVRYDHNFTCDCTGTDFNGPWCNISNARPQLRLPPWTQEVGSSQDRSDFEFQFNGRLNRTKWALDSSYRVAPVNISHGGYTDADVTANFSLSYALSWLNDSAPSGFFIEGQSAEILLQTPSTAGLYFAQVVALATGTDQAFLYNVTFEFLEADTANVTNGPAGRDCAGGTDQRVDVIEFDGAYTCNCPTDGTTTGLNCDVAAASVSDSSGSGTSTMVLAVVCSIVGLLIIVLAISRYEVYRAKHRPVDMEAMQDEIRALLGLGSANFDIKPNEFGVNLLWHTVEDGVTLECSDAHRIGQELLASLRSQSNLPSQLASMIKQSSTTIVVEVNECTALVRLKRPSGKTSAKSNAAEEGYISALQQRANKKKLGVPDVLLVTEVSVAVPKQVPLELSGKHHRLLRIDNIGEGKTN